MSVTIFAVPNEAVPLARQKRYAQDLFPALCVQPEDVEFYFAHDPAYEKDVGGYYTWQSAWPELNLSQANALAIMMVVGVDCIAHDWVGEFSVAELPALRKTIVRALNSSWARSIAVREDVRGTNFVEFGIRDDQVAVRLQRFLDVVCFAQEHGLAIGWN